jgi:uncharacterized repeat protein (TIGR02543 family)
MKDLNKIVLYFMLTAVMTFSACGGGGGDSKKNNNTTTYTVTYSSNGADSGSAPVDSTAYAQGATVTVPGNTGSLVKTGYTFAGWNTSADGSGTSYAQAATFTMGSANTTLYAKWTINPTYTVTYNANGATGGSAPSDTTGYEQGATVTVLGNTGSLVKTGYTFAGWNTSADGSGTSYAHGATFTMGSANVTLYANWNTVPVAVIASPADGSIYTYGDSITFTGSSTDAEDGGLSGTSLVWTSDIDGEIGSGATLAISSLSHGNHVITLTSTDGNGATGTDLINISIKKWTHPHPSPTISALTDRMQIRLRLPWTTTAMLS